MTDRMDNLMGAATCGMLCTAAQGQHGRAGCCSSCTGLQVDLVSRKNQDGKPQLLLLPAVEAWEQRVEAGC
jgi:hypothetical protein